ncbi:hypothetical protein OF83DRAFT_387247 [Amylostereum chailletii]|nr:hypothetical protein OF83DRAFT_387247 [Amylostereum chailletii]
MPASRWQIDDGPFLLSTITQSSHSMPAPAKTAPAPGSKTRPSPPPDLRQFCCLGQGPRDDARTFSVFYRNETVRCWQGAYVRFPVLFIGSLNCLLPPSYIMNAKSLFQCTRSS